MAKVMDQAGFGLVPLQTDETNEQPLPGIRFVDVSPEIDAAVEALDATLTFESATVQFRPSCPVRVLGKFFEAQQVQVGLSAPLTLAFDVTDPVLACALILFLRRAASGPMYLSLVLNQTFQIGRPVLALRAGSNLVVFRRGRSFQRFQNKIFLRLSRMVLRYVPVHQIRARGHEGAEPAVVSADHDELERVGET